ncbi:hypothetical protein B0T14DRAFT_72896 [Immersiella caudata]|uniref:Uncharacterized protein n=1 Tax=Immersiella caudata TaxID=314043 RepID=A0AA40CCM9_9PEZI|nr:hypothetical protein B0T14DRAFT_72896 [Immersiella caudata]
MHWKDPPGGYWGSGAATAGSSNAGPAFAPIISSNIMPYMYEPSRSKMADILQLYKEMFPNDDKMELPRMFQISPIPDKWDIISYDRAATDLFAGRIAEYEVYHEHVVKSQFAGQVRGFLPPPPPGYEEWSFRKYPIQGKHETQRYAIPARTVPRLNPLNEFTSEELLVLHDDRDLRKKMEAVWATIKREDLLKIRSSKRADETKRSFLLLWELCLLRMHWAGPLKAGLTIRWFVQEWEGLGY